MTTRKEYRRLREIAIRDGKLYYNGSKCQRCRGVKRYTSSSGCVICAQIIAHRKRAKGKTYASKNGPPVYEKDISLKLKKPWPEHFLEDAVIDNDVGTYRKQYHCPIQYAASAADL